jgi:malate dehydrogenase (oxaloacetate-decarboxylating)(NADP+)
MGNDNKMVRLMTNRAKLDPKRVVFAEADQLNVLKAAQIVYEDGIGFPILLGDKETILELKKELGFDAEVEIIDPKTTEEEARRNKFANSFGQQEKEEVFLYLTRKNSCEKETILQP